MRLTTRSAVLAGTILLSLGGSVATGAADPAAVPTCAGLPATIVVAAPGMVTFGDPGGVPADDVIVGTPGEDDIRGLAGDDVICGLDGDDRLGGGDGDDHVFGQGGDDDMAGGDGLDVLTGGPHVEGDRGNGGPGFDACPTTEIRISCP